MPDIEPTVLQQRTLVRAVVEQVESSALEPGIERVYSLAEIATRSAAGDVTGQTGGAGSRVPVACARGIKTLTASSDRAARARYVLERALRSETAPAPARACVNACRPRALATLAVMAVGVSGAGDLADSRRWNRTMARSPAAEAGMR
jgi:hypothetical protein